MSEAKTGAFDALLADIQGQTAETETLAKAVNGDDAKIEAAAAEGAEDGEDDEKKEGAEDEMLGKALVVQNADGTQTEGYDATDLIKSLVDRVEGTETSVKTALDAIVGLMGKQGALIKSLSEQVVSLSAKGTGRRSVITVAEKPGATADLAKALGGEEDTGAGMPKEEFLAKALEAAKGGLIDYRDANLAETLINKGAAPPANVLAAVARLKAKEA